MALSAAAKERAILPEAVQKKVSVSFPHVSSSISRYKPSMNVPPSGSAGWNAG